MNPQRAALKLERVADAFEAGGRIVAEETREDLHRTAYRWSSGPFSTKQLRRMDHPYARRHGSPRLSPRRINVQSGRFRSSWQSTVRENGAGQRVELQNTDPKAEKYLQPGTPRMFARGIDTAIAKEVFTRTEKRVERMIERALGRLR